MAKSDGPEFDSLMSSAKDDLRSGRASDADFKLLRAWEISRHMKSRERQAFVLHRLAEVAIQLEQPKLAERRLEGALKFIDKTNKLSYACLLRDYANYNRLHGEKRLGYKQVVRAVRLLQSIDPQTKRIKHELVVTEGIAARFDLDGPMRATALEKLHQTASRLRRYNGKRHLELANLNCLIDELPLTSIRRVFYIRRAAWICTSKGDFKRAGELMALLGGNLPRDAYNFIVR